MASAGTSVVFHVVCLVKESSDNVDSVAHYAKCSGKNGTETPDITSKESSDEENVGKKLDYEYTH